MSDTKLTRNYQSAMTKLREGGFRLLADKWDGLGNWSIESAATFIEEVGPVLAQIEAEAAALSSGYLTERGGSISADRLLIEQNLMNPFYGVGKELNNGANWEDAVAHGRQRAGKLGTERAILSARAIAGNTSGVTGWRRVPLGPTCAWCVQTSQQTYKTAKTASFGHGHGGVNYCDCDLVPIIGESDPGAKLNARTLQAWKAAEQSSESTPAYFDATAAKAAARPDTSV